MKTDYNKLAELLKIALESKDVSALWAVMLEYGPDIINALSIIGDGQKHVSALNAHAFMKKVDAEPKQSGSAQLVKDENRKTLRDEFAIAALKAHGPIAAATIGNAADYCYFVADAMLKARSK